MAELHSASAYKTRTKKWIYLY